MDKASSQNPLQLREQLVERLRELNKQIAELHEESESLKNDLEVTEQFIAVWRRTNDVAGPPEPTSVPVHRVRSEVSPRPRTRKNPRREKVVETALEIISAWDTPISRNDLYDALATNGIHIHGKDPMMVLSTMLWRSQDRIVRLSGRGYWIKDRPYPEANYYPQANDVSDEADTNRSEGNAEGRP